MTIATSSNISAALCKALGLNECNVTKIFITVRPNDVVEVDVTRLVGVDEFNQLINELTPYRLERRDVETTIEQEATGAPDMDRVLHMIQHGTLIKVQ